MLSQFSRVQLSVTPWAVAQQAPLSMGFSRQEYWSGLPCLPPGDLPEPGIEPQSLMSLGEFFTPSTTWERPLGERIKNDFSHSYVRTKSHPFPSHVGARGSTREFYIGPFHKHPASLAWPWKSWIWLQVNSSKAILLPKVKTQ